MEINEMKKVLTPFLIRLLVISVSFMFAGTATAVSRGQIVIELEDDFVEITEVRDDKKPYLDALAARVESLEGNVTVHEDVIAGLEAQNMIYAQQITDLILLAAQSNRDIAAAVNQIAVLDVDLQLLEMDSVKNADAIELLEDDVVALMTFIAANTDGLLILQTLIGNNFVEIAAIQEEVTLIQVDLARKQGLIKGGSFEPVSSLSK
jgi:hypothetical protein